MGKTWRNYPERNRIIRNENATLEYPGCEPESLNKGRRWELLDDLQSVAEQTGHQVEVSQPSFDFERARGYTDKGHAGSFGSVVHYVYHGNGKNLHRGATPNVLPAKEPLIIRLPPSDYRTRNQMRISPPSPCKACFWREGRIWMLRGTGNKAKNKTKGMKKLLGYIKP